MSEKFKAGDEVFVHYEGMTGRGVGWVLTEFAAKAVNRGVCPCGLRKHDRKVTVTRVPDDEVIHYYPDCGQPEWEGDWEAGHQELARSIRDTTCLVCLMKRAQELRGWRWSVDDNVKEVSTLKAKLGNRVDSFDVPLPENAEKDDEERRHYECILRESA